MTVPEKIKAVGDILRGMESVLVAHSGGADSSLVVWLAAGALRGRMLAVTGVSASRPKRECEEAAAFAAEAGAAHAIVETGEFSDERFVRNGPDRCYHCKRALFARLEEMRIARGLRWIADGSNADDGKDYRPGNRAAAEFNVRSPLAEAGLAKEDIREISRVLGLSTAVLPAQPCLATRIPYGTPVTVERLAMVERAEDALHGLGFLECRVRHHGDVARIELPGDSFARACEAGTRRAIDAALKLAGFRYVTVDLEPFRSGKMNDGLG